MPGDIKLEDNRVVVEGGRLDVLGSDIMLDSESRRSSAGGAYRRALVDWEGDVLALNFANDTGGTHLGGPVVRIFRKLLLGEDAVPNIPEADDSTIYPYNPIMSITPDFIKIISESRPPYDVARELNHLRPALLQLNERVKQMESQLA